MGRLAASVLLALAFGCVSSSAPDRFVAAAAGAFGSDETFEIVYLRSLGGLGDTVNPRIEDQDKVVRKIREAQASGLGVAVASNNARFAANTLASAMQIMGDGSLVGMRIVLVGDPADETRVRQSVQRTGASFGFVRQPPS